MAESRCRWGRLTRIDFNEVGPYLAPGLIHTTDSTPCGGAECKDRRSYPWEYRKQRLGKIVLLANEPERRSPGQITDRRVAKGERRVFLAPTRYQTESKPGGRLVGVNKYLQDDGSAWLPDRRVFPAQDRRRSPGQITDRRVAKGERRVPWVMHGYGPGGLYPYDSWPSGRRLRRPDKDRRRSQSAPVQTGGGHPEEHQRQPAEGIVRGEIIIHALRSNCAILCKCGGKGLTACDRQAAATHIEQQAAEIQRLNTWADGMADAALKERQTAEAYQAELRAEIQRLREALAHSACHKKANVPSRGIIAGWLVQHITTNADCGECEPCKARAALTPKEPT